MKGDTHKSFQYLIAHSGSLFIFEMICVRIHWCSWQCWFGSGASVCEYRNEGTSARCGQVNMVWFQRFLGGLLVLNEYFTDKFRNWSCRWLAN